MYTPRYLTRLEIHIEKSQNGNLPSILTATTSGNYLHNFTSVVIFSSYQSTIQRRILSASFQKAFPFLPTITTTTTTTLSFGARRITSKEAVYNHILTVLSLIIYLIIRILRLIGTAIVQQAGSRISDGGFEIRLVSCRHLQSCPLTPEDRRWDGNAQQPWLMRNDSRTHRTYVVSGWTLVLLPEPRCLCPCPCPYYNENTIVKFYVIL